MSCSFNVLLAQSENEAHNRKCVHHPEALSSLIVPLVWS